MDGIWISLLPPITTIILAIWTKRILVSLFAGLMIGSYLMNPNFIGGFETAVDYLVNNLADKGNLQVLLFLYLFSGLIAVIKKSGGVKAFSDLADKHIKSKNGVFYTLFALIPISFIDCGFRVVAAGSIIKPLSEKHKITGERLAFMLNNTASPVVELIPIATTFVGFNVGIVREGMKAAGIENGSAYSLLLQSIPLQFFSITIIIITFLSIYFQWGKSAKTIHEQDSSEKKNGGGKKMMNMHVDEPEIAPKVSNLLVPMLMVVFLSVFFFWYFGKEKDDTNFLSVIAATDPTKAMLIALMITIVVSSMVYLVQKYPFKKISADIISGGNQITTVLAILILAWPLADVSQDLGISEFLQQQVVSAIPSWGIAVSLFIIASGVTYFIGSSWGAASLIMPFAIPLAVSAEAHLPLTVAAVITGVTFGDVTSPVSGMTNMASNISRANHTKYISYLLPYNFTAAGITAILFIVAALLW